MITMKGLHEALPRILFGEDRSQDKYIVPLQGNWFVPTTALEDGDDSPTTWIGYLMLESRGETRSANYQGQVIERQMRQIFRLTFVGPQAEDLANSTFFWEERKDVQDAFVKMDAQVAYNQRRVYTRIFEQQGYNDTLVWVVDMMAMSTTAVTAEGWRPWIPLY
jgi:hypothetical protein